MKTIEIKLYSFEELNEKAQKRVLNELYDINVNHEWYEYIIDEFKEKLAEAGFLDAKIVFSGFCSQGSGASFDAKIDVKKFTNIKRLINIVEEHNSLFITKNSYANHYSHERTRYTAFDATGRINIDSKLEELCNSVEERRLTMCREIYNELEREYDYLTSEKAIIETINDNDYHFEANGKIRYI